MAKIKINKNQDKNLEEIKKAKRFKELMEAREKEKLCVITETTHQGEENITNDSLICICDEMEVEKAITNFPMVKGICDKDTEDQVESKVYSMPLIRDKELLEAKHYQSPIENRVISMVEENEVEGVPTSKRIPLCIIAGLSENEVENMAELAVVYYKDKIETSPIANKNLYLETNSVPVYDDIAFYKNIVFEKAIEIDDDFDLSLER